MKGKVYTGGGGGINIDGIIEQYKVASGGNVNMRRLCKVC